MGRRNTSPWQYGVSIYISMGTNCTTIQMISISFKALQCIRISAGVWYILLTLIVITHGILYTIFHVPLPT